LWSEIDAKVKLAPAVELLRLAVIFVNAGNFGPTHEQIIRDFFAVVCASYAGGPEFAKN